MLEAAAAMWCAVPAESMSQSRPDPASPRSRQSQQRLAGAATTVVVARRKTCSRCEERNDYVTLATDKHVLSVCPLHFPARVKRLRRNEGTRVQHAIPETPAQPYVFAWKLSGTAAVGKGTRRVGCISWNILGLWVR